MCDTATSCATETMTTACPATGAGSNTQPLDSTDSLCNHNTNSVSSKDDLVVSDIETNHQHHNGTVEPVMNGSDQTHATGLTDAANGNVIYKQPTLQANGTPSMPPQTAAHSSKRTVHTSPEYIQTVDSGMGCDSLPGSDSTSGGASPNNQHVVHVHINPGEMFSVRMGDQMQHIQGAPPPFNPGPATVRMVSNNGPPLPMPMQVPPGHMVQQIVDEHGILTHVILSPQPTGPPGMSPHITPGGPNGVHQQIYGSPYNPPQYTYPTHNSYAPHHHAGATPPHIHVQQTPLHATQPPLHTPTTGGHQTTPQQNHCPSHGHNTQGHINHSPHSHMDERTQRQKTKLQNRLQTKYNKDSNYQSKHREKNGGVNGVGPLRYRDAHREANHKAQQQPQQHTQQSQTTHQQTQQQNAQPQAAQPQPDDSTTTTHQDLEEERSILQKLISNMDPPKVMEIEGRSAMITLLPPDCSNHQEFEIEPGEFKFELQLSESRDNKFNTVYSGDATEITLKDLAPATEYFLKVCALLDDLKGDLTASSNFTTLPCEPEKPLPPKLSSRTKTTLILKWSNTDSNGSKITTYLLEWDQGDSSTGFVECYSGPNRQHKVTRLNPSTPYSFRMSAKNAIGFSEPSEVVEYYTSGSTPSQPDPPMLSERFVQGLCISWIRRPNDDNFILQMEDEATGHGFLPVYNGPDLSYHIKNLRRNTKYKYRLNASNEEGSSKWSESVTYCTLPDHPAPPPKPQVRGKVHSTSFKVTWDPPRDTGGADITNYTLEMDDDSGYCQVYSGMEREYVCDRLQPGETYSLRVNCESEGGRSKWSEALSITTQPVAPSACQPPKVKGKPKSNSIHLHWYWPDYNGGANVNQFEIQMTDVDDSQQVVYRGSSLDCNVSGLLPGRCYAFQTRAFNKVGCGPWSESVCVCTGASVPDAPVEPSLHCKSAHSCTVSWVTPQCNGAEVNEYRLEWHTEGGDFALLYSGPSVQHEVKGLTPATPYWFRVQAINSAGVGAFSTTASITTPAASPGAVVSLRYVPHTTALDLVWKEPSANGSEITAYNIELNDRHITVDNVHEYSVEDLSPHTTYKVRVQAVNAVGVGAFSTVVKMVTLPLPPRPPRLECVPSHNHIKLKWGDNTRHLVDLIEYTVEMARESSNGSFGIVYRGSGVTHKVSKLSELSDYYFRIHATNDTGDGPLSPVYHCKTTKAPPPQIKVIKIGAMGNDFCEVDWTPCRPISSDSLLYSVQVHTTHNDSKMIYRASECKFRIDGLSPSTGYGISVCAIRQFADGSGELQGSYSPPTFFTTPGPKAIKATAVTTNSSSVSGGAGGANDETATADKTAMASGQLTDQHWAIIIVIGFTLFAGLVAVITQQMIG